MYGALVQKALQGRRDDLENLIKRLYRGEAIPETEFSDNERPVQSEIYEAVFALFYLVDTNAKIDDWRDVQFKKNKARNSSYLRYQESLIKALTELPEPDCHTCISRFHQQDDLKFLLKAIASQKLRFGDKWHYWRAAQTINAGSQLSAMIGGDWLMRSIRNCRNHFTLLVEQFFTPFDGHQLLDDLVEVKIEDFPVTTVFQRYKTFLTNLNVKSLKNSLEVMGYSRRARFASELMDAVDGMLAITRDLPRDTHERDHSPCFKNHLEKIRTNLRQAQQGKEDAIDAETLATAVHELMEEVQKVGKQCEAIIQTQLPEAIQLYQARKSSGHNERAWLKDVLQLYTLHNDKTWLDMLDITGQMTRVYSEDETSDVCVGEIRFIEGRLYEQKGDLRKAYQAYHEAANQDYFPPMPAYRMGLIKIAQGKLAQAKIHLVELEKYHEENLNSREWTRVLVRRLRDAVTKLESILEIKAITQVRVGEESYEEAAKSAADLCEAAGGIVEEIERTKGPDVESRLSSAFNLLGQADFGGSANSAEKPDSSRYKMFSQRRSERPSPVSKKCAAYKEPCSGVVQDSQEVLSRSC